MSGTSISITGNSNDSNLVLESSGASISDASRADTVSTVTEQPVDNRTASERLTIYDEAFKSALPAPEADVRICLCCSPNDGLKTMHQQVILKWLEANPGKTVEIRFCATDYIRGTKGEGGHKYLMEYCYPTGCDLVVATDGVSFMNSMGPLLSDAKSSLATALSSKHNYITYNCKVTPSALNNDELSELTNQPLTQYSWSLARLNDSKQTELGFTPLPASFTTIAEFTSWVNTNVPTGKYFITLPTVHPLADQSFKIGGSYNNISWYHGIYTVFNMALIGANKHREEYTGTQNINGTSYKKAVGTTMFDFFASIKDKIKFVDSYDECYKSVVRGEVQYSLQEANIVKYGMGQKLNELNGDLGWGEGLYDETADPLSHIKTLEDFNSIVFQNLPYISGNGLSSPQGMVVVDSVFKTRCAGPTREKDVNSILSYYSGKEAGLIFVNNSKLPTQSDALQEGKSLFTNPLKIKENAITESLAGNNATNLDLLVTASTASKIEKEFAEFNLALSTNTHNSATTASNITTLIEENNAGLGLVLEAPPSA